MSLFFAGSLKNNTVYMIVYMYKFNLFDDIVVVTVTYLLTNDINKTLKNEPECVIYYGYSLIN